MAKLADELSDLYKYHMTAVKVYKDVLRLVEDSTTKKKLESFLKDHQDHLGTLLREIIALSGMSPINLKDFKGLFVEDYANLHNATSQTGALKVLQTTEAMVVAKYRSIIDQPLPKTVSDIVHNNLTDEEKHMKYINQLDL